MKKPYFVASMQQIQPVGAVRHYRCHIFFVFSPGVKERNSVSPLTDFDVPTSFWYELKSLTEALMDNVTCELLETDAPTPSCHDALPLTQNTFVHFHAV